MSPRREIARATTATTPVVPAAATTGRAATVGQRIRAELLSAGSALIGRLPEAPLVALAEAVGEVWYRAAPRRAARGRRNLHRVVTYLAANGLGGRPVQAAATDPAALERMLRRAFRHAARYYLEMALAPSMTAAVDEERLIIETPEAVAEAFRPGRPVIFVGLHFGALELPGFYLARRTGRTATVPMETLGDPALQAYVARSRGSVGIRIVDLRDARRELVAALERGESIGIVADRNVAGGTVEVPFFGLPAALPMGPGLLASEAGAPVFVAGVRRAPHGRYLGQLRAVSVATVGTRRERLTATMAAVARAMEETVAADPAQWWTIFFPIWADLDPAATGRGTTR